MTIETQIHDYLRDVDADPMRSNIVKAGHLRKHTDANGTQAGMILRAMFRGDIDGVELSIFKEPSANQTQYTIEAIEDTLTGRLFADAETCVEVRQLLKTGNYTQEEVAAQTGVSPTQVSTHGRGHCSHDVDESPVELGYHETETAEVEG